MRTQHLLRHRHTYQDIKLWFDGKCARKAMGKTQVRKIPNPMDHEGKDEEVEQLYIEKSGISRFLGSLNRHLR